MKEIDVEAHEAGHALAAFYYNVPIQSVSTYRKDGESSRLRLERGTSSSELVIATILVAGQMAEKRALGHVERFNWFGDDVDTVNARDMVDSIVEHDGADLFETRRLVELRARGLLVTKWRAIEALAAGLRKSKRLTGDEVVAICRREGVRRLGELSRDEVLAKLTPEGRRNFLGTVGPDGRTMVMKRRLIAPSLTEQLAEVEQEIDEVKAQLDQPDDDPALWPLRKRLTQLFYKRRELLDQVEGGTHR